jgi:hypothetical protein
MNINTLKRKLTPNTNTKIVKGFNKFTLQNTANINGVSLFVEFLSLVCVDELFFIVPLHTLPDNEINNTLFQQNNSIKVPKLHNIHISIEYGACVFFTNNEILLSNLHTIKAIKINDKVTLKVRADYFYLCVRLFIYYLFLIIRLV